MYIGREESYLPGRKWVWSVVLAYEKPNSAYAVTIDWCAFAQMEQLTETVHFAPFTWKVDLVDLLKWVVLTARVCKGNFSGYNGLI